MQDIFMGGVLCPRGLNILQAGRGERLGVCCRPGRSGFSLRSKMSQEADLRIAITQLACSLKQCQFEAPNPLSKGFLGALRLAALCCSARGPELRDEI